MSKSPYEVRLDLLQMSKDMLDKQYQMSMDMVWKTFESNKEMYKDIEKYMPKMFTSEEIISQAEKLQEFINKK
jgi:hypothetical protein